MEENEVIDLTQSFTYCRAPINLDSEVIDLDDSVCSVYASPRPVAPVTVPIDLENDTEAIAFIVAMNAKEKEPKKKKRPNKPARPNYGDCPICRDPLGTCPMSSTKCGHVYCTSCIEQAVKIEKKCPTCRKPLKGATAYHPLFL